MVAPRELSPPFRRRRRPRDLGGGLNGFGRRTTCRNINFAPSPRRPSCTSASGSRWSRWSSIASAPTSRSPASTRRRSPRLPAAGQRHPGHVQHVLRRRRRADGDLRAERDAVHLGVDHRAVLIAPSFPPLESLKKEGEGGRKQLNQYTRYLTVVLALVAVLRHRHRPADQRRRGRQSRALLRRLHRRHADRRHHVPDVAGRADHRARRRQRHLADHLRRHRRGPAERTSCQTLGLAQHGPDSTSSPCSRSSCLAIGVVVFIVFIERSQRRLLIQYPKRQQGNRMVGGESSFLPLKINTAGVIPPIFASSLLLLPTTMASFAGHGATCRTGWRGCRLHQRLAAARPAAVHGALRAR